MYTYEVNFDVDTEFREPFKIKVFAEDRYTAVFLATLIFCHDSQYRFYDGYIRSIFSVNLLKS